MGRICRPICEKITAIESVLRVSLTAQLHPLAGAAVHNIQGIVVIFVTHNHEVLWSVSRDNLRRRLILQCLAGQKIQHNAAILLIGSLGTAFNEILIKNIMDFRSRKCT